MRRYRAVLPLLIGLFLALTAGCGGSSYNRISDILDNPSRFLNQEVDVHGEVTKVYELPLGITNVAAYRVNDGSGQMWVISHSGAPVAGDRLNLKARVREMSTLNLPVLGDILGAVLEEEQRRR